MTRIVSASLITVLLLCCGNLALTRVDSQRTRTEEQGLAIVGAKVYLSPVVDFITDGVVLIKSVKIVDVGKNGKIRIPPDFEKINASGMTLTAGFWNCHVHFAEDKWQNAATIPPAELTQHLLKPFTQARFYQALERAKSRLRSGEPALDRRILSLLEQMAKGPDYLQRLAVKSARGTIFINVSEVEWIEAAENYVRMHMREGEPMIQTTMNAISKRLDPSVFVRIHRSRIVNVNHIQSVHLAFHGEYILKLKNGVQLRTGRTYSDDIKRLLKN